MYLYLKQNDQHTFIKEGHVKGKRGFHHHHHHQHAHKHAHTAHNTAHQTSGTEQLPTTKPETSSCFELER